MLKTLRTATILAGVSAFAIPAMAQTGETIVPGSQTMMEENDAATRDNVAEQSTIQPAQTENPSADPVRDTIVPGSETLAEQNEADERDEVARGISAETTGDMAGEGDDILVPGSGATFTPGEEPEGQSTAVQEESVDLQN
ncbi:hypothetical protein [Fulvimarina sp. MAC8]|uniref:hypothetical protein n=1 Tax=Fulvimarina sp. MAC8 TaxID=3162874 RepID=UPI0032EE5425